MTPEREVCPRCGHPEDTNICPVCHDHYCAAYYAKNDMPTCGDFACEQELINREVSR